MSYENQCYHPAEDLNGHSCKGFKEFQKYGKEETCSPFINKKCLIEGCDNANDIAIKFCPFCGEEITALTDSQEMKK